MTSVAQDNNFVKVIADHLPSDLLETAIDWIGKNLNPEDVFSGSDLIAWAEDNDFIHHSKIDQK